MGLHLANDSARCYPLLTLEALLGGIRNLLEALSPLLWPPHLDSFCMCVHFSSRSTYDFSHDLSVSCPSLYYSLYSLSHSPLLPV